LDFSQTFQNKMTVSKRRVWNRHKNNTAPAPELFFP